MAPTTAERIGYSGKPAETGARISSKLDLCMYKIEKQAWMSGRQWR